VRARGNRKGFETVQGNCVRCNRRTRHAIRSLDERAEYFECLRCGNKVDVKAFVYDNLDALD
jgi:DNA-directed RNA polymerase subunit RPC12/RpoP